MRCEISWTPVPATSSKNGKDTVWKSKEIGVLTHSHHFHQIFVQIDACFKFIQDRPVLNIYVSAANYDTSTSNVANKLSREIVPYLADSDVKTNKPPPTRSICYGTNHIV